jgi:uncharacterized protein
MDPQQSKLETNSSSKNNKMALSIDLRLLVLVLLAIIGVMLFVWKPWDAPSPDAKNRVISVTGEATITAVPDEYVFSPDYTFKNADKAAALASITKKSDEVTKKLKSLGVADSKIKSDSSGYNYSYYYDESARQNNYSLHLTVTVDNKELAQKVQDYLVTTEPTGSISPQASFSDKKRKELENQARDKAAEDARSKADRTAQKLGFTVGKVKSISDSSDSTGRMYFSEQNLSLASGADDAKEKSLSVQPGENELPYSITVTYYVKD